MCGVCGDVCVVVFFVVVGDCGKVKRQYFGSVGTKRAEKMSFSITCEKEKDKRKKKKRKERKDKRSEHFLSL